MSNGKDFYVELRKQVTALQQNVERAGMFFSAEIYVVSSSKTLCVTAAIF